MKFKLHSLLRYAASAAMMWALWAGAAQAQVIKVGVLTSLTGPHSAFDLPASEGLQMAAEEINRAGGVNVKGKKYTIQLVQEDSQSKPEFSVSGAQRLLRDDDVKVIFGTAASGPGAPAATLFSKNEAMYLASFTLLDTMLGKPDAALFLRTLNNDEIVARQFVPIVTSEMAIKKIGIALPNDDVSRSILANYKPLFEKAGVAVPQVEFFQADTADFAPVLRKFQGKGLDALFVGTNDSMVEAIVRQSLEIGGLPKKFVYRGGSGAPGIKYAKDLDGFAWQIVTRDIENTSDPKVKAWVERYKAFTKKDLASNSWWGLALYDSLFMVAKSMEAAGTISDAKAIAAKMKGNRYEGVRSIRFDNDGRANSDFDVGILKGGQITSVRARIE